MQTDKIFHSLFSAYPQFFFELLGLPPETADEYEGYKSEEVKETAFRLDGVLVPKMPNRPLLFVEVQFQKDPNFYRRVFAEIFMYLDQHRFDGHWKAISLFKSKGVEPKRTPAYQHFFEHDLIEVIHLKPFLKQSVEHTLGLDLLRLIISTDKEAIPLARRLLESQWGEQNISELIETIVLYHFQTKTRAEIQAMLNLGFDVKQTVLYQEAKAEGREQGIEQGIEQGRDVGFAEGLIELLTDRFGNLPDTITEQILATAPNILKGYYKKAWKVETLDEVFS